MPRGKTSLSTDLFAELASRTISRMPRDVDPRYAQRLVENPSVLGELLQQTFMSPLEQPLFLEEIMERLKMLDQKACVRMRPAFPRGPMKWYVDMGQVVVGSFGFPGWCSPDLEATSASSPTEALINTWNYVLTESQNPNNFFLIYDCKDIESIPGDKPQVWVQWNKSKDSWEDVVPSDPVRAIRNIHSGRIRKFATHLNMHRP